MKKIIFLLVFTISNLTLSQSLNRYKYAIVPEKYSFQKNKNDYNLNELTKAAMRKYGFEPYFETEILPKDISNENKVYVDVLEKSSMIYTKLIVVLRDYTNNVLFRSADGKSKEKEFSEAYEECFRQAMQSFDILKHQYLPNQIADIDVKTSENQNINSVLIPYSANKIANGFKLLNGDQGFKFVIYETSNPNIFIVNTPDEKNQIGVLIHKQNDSYSFEYYTNGKLNKEIINILF
jgi:hypothetical protein